MKEIAIVVLNFIKGIVRCLSFLVIVGCSVLIFKIANEKGKDKEITVRKARRIRFFTRFKRFLGKHLWLADLTGFKDEIIETNKILGYGV